MMGLMEQNYFYDYRYNQKSWLRVVVKTDHEAVLKLTIKKTGISWTGASVAPIDIEEDDQGTFEEREKEMQPAGVQR